MQSLYHCGETLEHFADKTTTKINIAQKYHI